MAYNMSFWRKTGGRPEADKEIPAIIERIDQLTSQLDDLGKLVRDLEFEWNETYEKFRRLHMKLSKRDKRAEQAEGQPVPDEDGELNAETTNPMALRLLNRR